MNKDLHHAVGNSTSVVVCCLQRLKEIIIQAAFSLRAYACHTSIRKSQYQRYLCTKDAYHTVAERTKRARRGQRAVTLEIRGDEHQNSQMYDDRPLDSFS